MLRLWFHVHCRKDDDQNDDEKKKKRRTAIFFVVEDVGTFGDPVTLEDDLKAWEFVDL